MAPGGHGCRSHVYILAPFLAANLRGTHLRKELSEVESNVEATNSENIKLKRDKMLLTDEVANLQARVSFYRETLSYSEEVTYKIS